jgi:phage FluMu protein Com
MAGGWWEETTPRKAFTQRDRMAIWDREFGPNKDRAKCPLCKRNEISRNHFAIGHKKALAKGGSNSIRNVRPICHSCNSMMSTMNMADYIKKYAPSAKPAPKSKTTSKKITKKTTKKQGRRRSRDPWGLDSVFRL